MVYGAHQRMDISKCTDTHLVNDLLQGKPFMSCSIVNCNSEVCTRVHSPYSSKYVSQVCCTAHSTIHAPLSLSMPPKSLYCFSFLCLLFLLSSTFAAIVFRISNIWRCVSFSNKKFTALVLVSQFFDLSTVTHIYARNIFRVCNFKYFELTRAKTKLVN